VRASATGAWRAASLSQPRARASACRCWTSPELAADGAGEFGAGDEVVAGLADAGGGAGVGGFVSGAVPRRLPAGALHRAVRAVVALACTQRAARRSGACWRGIHGV
jgi:hypothetical protein